MIGDYSMEQSYIKYITVPVNKILLDHYSELGLDEQSLIILIKMIENDRLTDEAPEFSELIKGTTLNQSELTRIIQLLIKEKCIELQTIKKEDGYVERFNFEPLYKRLEDFIYKSVEEPQKDEKPLREMFDYIENLYGRTISPNEYQRLNSWINDSNYQVEDIMNAVDVAYKSNITSLQYVERILLSTSKSEDQKGTGLPVISWLDRGERLDNE